MGRRSLRQGEVLEVSTPLGVVEIRAGRDDGRESDVFDIRAKPNDPRLDGRVLLANVQNRSHTVRLEAYSVAIVDLGPSGVSGAVWAERVDLVRRVLSAASEHGYSFDETTIYEVAKETAW